MAKAVWFTGPKVAELRDEHVDAPSVGEVQVAARYSLVSPGTEMNLYRGEAALPHLVLPTAAGTLPFPVKFAYQTVGEIVAVPAGSPWNVGQLAFCTHPHQNLFNIATEPGLISVLPAGTNLRKAVFGAMFTVALSVLLDRPVRPGDCVAVTGLGLIGLFAARLARMSASRLILIDPLAERRARARWIGADAIAHPDQAHEVVDELTSGRGVDLFIEASGNGSALQMGMQVTGDAGTVAVASWYGTRPVTLLLSPEFHLRRQTVRSIHVAGIAKGEYAGWTPERALQTCVQYLEGIDETQLVTHEFAFPDAAAAYQLIDRSPEQTLGVLLRHS